MPNPDGSDRGIVAFGRRRFHERNGCGFLGGGYGNRGKNACGDPEKCCDLEGLAIDHDPSWQVRPILAADNPSKSLDASIFAAASTANAGIGVFYGVCVLETSAWSDSPDR